MFWLIYMNKNFLKYVVVALFFGSSICSASNLVDEMEHHCKEIINIFVASRANAICGFQKIDAEAWEIYSGARCQFLVAKPYIDFVTSAMVSRQQRDLAFYGREAMCQSLEEQHQKMVSIIERYKLSSDGYGRPQFYADAKKLCLGVFEVGSYNEEFQVCGINQPIEHSKKIFAALGCRVIVTSDDTTSILEDGKEVFDEAIKKNGQELFCKSIAPTLKIELDKALKKAESKLRR